MLFSYIYKFLKKDLYSIFDQYNSTQWYSQSKLENLRLKRLQDILKYAYFNVSFYKELWDRNGIDYNISSISDLNKFPIVTKDMLRQAISNNNLLIKNSNLIWNSTTGSTGEPFRFPTDQISEYHRQALRMRAYSWYGMRFNIDKVVLFWRGKYKKNIFDFFKEYLTKRYNLCIYDPKYPVETKLNDERISYFINRLNTIKPLYIDGFVSSLVDISRYIIKNNIKFDFVIKAITTGAEKLSTEDRLIINKAFKCKVFNRYGGTESSLIAHECQNQVDDSNMLHIQDDKIILESNHKNEFIFTDLITKPIPFIRYKNGDLGEIITDYKCSCGRVFTMIKSIEGRINDFFYLPDGSKLSSHLFQNYIKKFQGIKKYRLIQYEDYSVEIIFILDPKLFIMKDFDLVKSLFNNLFKDCKVLWTKVDKLDLSIGGKFRQFISYVENSI